MWNIINAIGPWLVGGFIFGVPVWLAWWLSDGFEGFLDWPSGGTHVGVAVNPTTHKSCTAVISNESGQPISYGG